MSIYVTSRGRVTIPSEIRKALGIGAGTLIEFKLDGGSLRLFPIRRESPSDVEAESARGRREDFERFLAAVPDSAPLEGDEREQS